MPRLPVLIACLSLAACNFGASEPTVIDGSSEEAYQRTLKEARSELGPKDRLKFEGPLAEFRAQMFAKADDRQDYQRLVRQGMDGLTAPRIVSQFNKDVDRVGGQAADAAFDVKRAVTGRRAPGSE